MDIGSLDRQILIEAPMQSQDEYGSAINTWSTYFRGSASALDVLAGSREATNQDIRLTNRPVKIRMRYVPDITVNMRVTLLDRGNRLLQIVTPPAELGRKEGLEFICEEYSA